MYNYTSDVIFDKQGKGGVDTTEYTFFAITPAHMLAPITILFFSLWAGLPARAGSFREERKRVIQRLF